MITSQEITHPVIGFRSWSPNVAGALQSRAFSDHTWQPGVNTARCLAVTHITPDHVKIPRNATNPTYLDVPSGPCNCGLQAHHDFDGACYYFRGWGDQTNSIYGIVKGWGHIEIHPDGWRSQYAEIKAILPSPNQEYAKLAARFYGVPLLNSLDSLDIQASEFGKKVPVELRPEPYTIYRSIKAWAHDNPKDALIIGGVIAAYVFSCAAAFALVRRL